jgi:arylsulfatase A-like enzyme
MIKRILLGLSLALAIPAHAAPPPNIVFMLIDDLGWQELKCYDIDAPSPADTPNMDALAKRGILFRHGYSPAPSCTPSRCAIMSGNHPARAQTTHVMGGNPPGAKPNQRMITPWFSGRMPANEQTIAKTLRENGYATGHAGKWHMSYGHFAFPGPLAQGFDFTTHEGAGARGIQRGMKNRLQEFATDQPGDPYRLDAEGFPTDSVTEGALKFMEKNKDKPFFLYYATWLVHTPIQSRSKALVDKYCQKLGVDPADRKAWPPNDGQKNPFFCAMVETLDHYVGQLVTFLETTDDPRNPGHKLIDNTYIFFSSDNGGVEGSKGEGVSDNAPLDKGKTSPREGGVRVPFLVAGPGIPADKESDVVVNGLDFFPTILSIAGVKKPEGKNLDGANLLPLLTGAVEDSSLVLDQNGKPRTDMIWHYPHGNNQSTIRAGDFKLIRNYDTQGGKVPALELYHLVDTKDGKSARVDIEEANNIAAEQPEKAAALNTRLTEILTEMKASLPYWNPTCSSPLPNHEKVPGVTGHTVDGQTVTATFKENGARVVRADAIYTTKDSPGEWFRMIGEVDNGTAKLTLPPEATETFINLIDENNFMVSYPQAAAASPTGRGGKAEAGGDGEDGGGAAVGGAIPLAVTVKGSAPSHAQENKKEIQFNKLDADKSGTLTMAEYTSIAKGPEREAAFTARDTDKDGSLTLLEFCTPPPKK